MATRDSCYHTGQQGQSLELLFYLQTFRSEMYLIESEGDREKCINLARNFIWTRLTKTKSSGKPLYY